ncbi:hypothetical protein [[Muricauda] lutisoli]|uniref:Uncharacterized protein n=1 Tax=[Muricauda] lutisoli TaxID=2816035 RepID=A0ABS3EV21_9FLAO|nr:hypothetical protein [[Muricauda] lutisoli]MBO0330091.1 hypothetical protein [[Muricauda] lutisoli]
MTIEKAIQRIEWRFFTSFKNIYVNENDIQAVSKLLNFIENQRKGRLIGNGHFSKLYVAHLNCLIKHYQTSIIDPIPIKKLHYIISRPLDLGIHELVDTLNSLEQYKILERCGCKGITHPNTQESLEKGKIMEKLQNLLEVDGNRKKIFGQSWEFGEVKEGIEKQIKYVLDGQ